jgi:transposase-like protein
MDLKLHANATTTPKTRAYIQASKASVAELAAELGVSESTVRRWQKRTTVEDRSHTPHNLQISLSPVEEELVGELRRRLWLSLDDLTEVMKRCVNPELSRSAIHRCLVRLGINRKPPAAKPEIGVFEPTEVGFIHVDLKHLSALEKQNSYAFVAIDRNTRYVYMEIHTKRDAATAVAFIERFLDHFPQPVHTILTDNGGEFTDRCSVDTRDKLPGKPSGRHPFDRLCKRRGIEHRLTRPFRPRTNGLVERFNRRIVDAIGRQPKRGTAHRLFRDRADRDAFLDRFVSHYNRTRLRCLDYRSPLQAIQALGNLPGHNTFAQDDDGVCPSRPRRARPRLEEKTKRPPRGAAFAKVRG